MANQLAVTDNKALQTEITLGVSNVQNLNDYAKVLQVIRHLAAVMNVSIKDMNGSDLLLSIKAAGGEQALVNALSSDSRFVALDTSNNSNSSTDLFYRWQGNERRGSG